MNVDCDEGKSYLDLHVHMGERICKSNQHDMHDKCIHIYMSWILTKLP